jgi:ubiquinone/menaquinone biosynthesis C-methylase UbiE
MNSFEKMKNTDHLHYRKVIDQNYVSPNLLIQLVLNRLLKNIAGLLNEINAASLRTLDVGCGEGHMIEYFKQQGLIGNYVGVDLNPDKVSHASINHPTCNYMAADVGALAFKSNTFDCVLAAEMLEHLPDPALALKEIKRVAKSGAYFIVSVPHEPFFRWGNLIRGKYWDRGGKTPSHRSFWSRSEFKKMLRQHCDINKEHIFSSFPWLLLQCRF